MYFHCPCHEFVVRCTYAAGKEELFCFSRYNCFAGLQMRKTIW